MNAMTRRFLRNQAANEQVAAQAEEALERCPDGGLKLAEKMLAAMHDLTKLAEMDAADLGMVLVLARVGMASLIENQLSARMRERGEL